MKKIYLLALAATVAFGASARFQKTETFSGAKPQNVVAKKAAFSSIANVNKPAKAPTAGATIADYDGEYTLSCVWGLSSGSAPETLNISVTDAAAGTVAITGFTPYQDFVVKGTLDLTAGTLSIANNQDLGKDTEGDECYFYVKGFNADYSGLVAGALNVAATVGTIDGKTITFPEDDIWAIGDPNAENLGYWFLSMDNSLTYGVADPNVGWEDWGEATFQDGWVCPALGIDQTDPNNWYKVKLQKSTEYDGVFRLVDPYLGDSPVAKYNAITTGGYISFDISDPDHVYFGVDRAGFANETLDITNLYCYNTMTWAMLYLGVGPDELIATYSDYIDFSTYDATEHVLTLSCPMTAPGYEPDACFGVPGEEDGGYCWTDSNDEAANMETKIFFNATEASVSDVIATETGAKEYFNLQGVRVANPSNGVYIVRQNGKATKEYIR